MPRAPGPGVDKLNVGSGMFGEANKPVSKEVEDEANSYFQRIYNHPPHPTLSIEEVLDMLKKFMESTKPRERVSQLILSKECAAVQWNKSLLISCK